jgi:hypothetical protein
MVTRIALSMLLQSLELLQMGEHRYMETYILGGLGEVEISGLLPVCFSFSFLHMIIGAMVSYYICIFNLSLSDFTRKYGLIRLAKIYSLAAS